MSAFPFQQSSTSYVAQLVTRVCVEEGVLHCVEGGDARRIEAGEVIRALCAQVGEPEGVRTVVFDLVVRIDDATCVAYRFDADPGDDARDLADSLERELGGECCSLALREVAKDGYTGHWFPDVGSFEDDNLALLESDGRRG